MCIRDRVECSSGTERGILVSPYSGISYSREEGVNVNVRCVESCMARCPILSIFMTHNVCLVCLRFH